MTFVFATICGMTYNTLTPIGIQSLMETLYPNHELSVGFLYFVVTNALNFIGNDVAVALNDKGLYTLTFLVLLTFFLIIFWYRTEFNRNLTS